MGKTSVGKMLLESVHHPDIGARVIHLLWRKGFRMADIVYAGQEIPAPPDPVMAMHTQCQIRSVPPGVPVPGNGRKFQAAPGGKGTGAVTRKGQVQRPPGHIGVAAHTGYGMGPAGMVTQEGDGSMARPQTDAEGTFGPPVSGFPVR